MPLPWHVVGAAVLAASGALVQPATAQMPVAATPAAASTSSVSGRLTTDDNRPLLSAAVVLARSDDASAGASPSSATVLPDGRFSFAGIAPGRYVIRARGVTAPHAPVRFSQYMLTMDGQDVSGLEMILQPGALLAGSVVIDGDRRTAPRLNTLRVRAPLVDGSRFGEALTGSVQPNGTFSIRGLMDGMHVLVVEGLVHPWVVKSVSWHGHDITTDGIDAEQGLTFSDVRITISGGPPAPFTTGWPPMRAGSQ